MGEYFVIANLDKHERFCPNTFGEGLKLREFAPGRGGTAMVLTLLLADQWKGDRVAVVGDEGSLPGMWEHAHTFRDIGHDLRRDYADDIAECAEEERLMCEDQERIRAENARLTAELSALQKAVRDALAGSNVTA